jgi:Fe-Mn family superoxide dismutase
MLGKKFLALGALILFVMACGSNSQPSLPTKPPYEAQDFSRLKGMKGFSNNALDLHFALYQGYVKNTNLIWEELRKMADQNQTMTPAYAELKRRFGWEFNGMRLHELYFGNLGGTGPLPLDSPLMQRIVENFGSFDKWAADFKATGSMRGLGWAVLYEDPTNGRLFNTWINEHDVDHLAGGQPLLIMDVFEHAYLTDYGLRRDRYIEAFFENINWRAVENRFIQ